MIPGSDDETEIGRTFDDRVSIARKRRPLSNVTNRPASGGTNRPKNVFMDALSNPTLCYSYGRNGMRTEGDVEKNEEASHTRGSAQTEPGKREKIKFIEPDIEELRIIRSPVASGERRQTTNGCRICGGDDGRSLLLDKIQSEFNELKEAHRRALETRCKLIKVMERELAEYKKKLKASVEGKLEEMRKRYDDALRKKDVEIDELKRQLNEGRLGPGELRDAEIKKLKERCEELDERRREEIEELGKEYDAKLRRKKEEHKELCRRKIMEYREMVDGLYKEKASEYRNRCNEKLRRIKASTGAARPSTRLL
jgi:hypothetical protein